MVLQFVGQIVDCFFKILSIVIFMSCSADVLYSITEMVRKILVSDKIPDLYVSSFIIRWSHGDSRWEVAILSLLNKSSIHGSHTCTFMHVTPRYIARDSTIPRRISSSWSVNSNVLED